LARHLIAGAISALKNVAHETDAEMRFFWTLYGFGMNAFHPPWPINEARICSVRPLGGRHVPHRKAASSATRPAAKFAP
jgi:hypothetical protein